MRLSAPPRPPSRRVADRALALAAWGAAIAVSAAFVWLLSDLLASGLGHIDWNFLTTEPQAAGRRGGIAPILVSTLLVLAVAMAAAVPLGLACAAWLSEYARVGGPTARRIRMALDVLAGVPSIVFGLFGNALFSVWLGLGFSILSGGLTLACMVLPILIRTTELGLSAVPTEWRTGAAALGLSRAAALRHVILPAAAPALTAGLLLGIGRALAETAALIFTSGYVDRMPGTLLDSGRALAVHIYDLSMNVSGGDGHAYASALVLIALLLVTHGLAEFAAERWARQRMVRP